jgi:hypothetical protein
MTSFYHICTHKQLNKIFSLCDVKLCTPNIFALTSPLSGQNTQPQSGGTRPTRLRLDRIHNDFLLITPTKWTPTETKARHPHTWDFETAGYVGIIWVGIINFSN